MPSQNKSNRPTLYLIDGSAYVYRAFFALPPLSNSQGLQTNAIYGFTTMLMKILREHRPDCLAVAFDEKGPTLRHAEYKEYKAHRPEMPDAMEMQLPYIHRVVEALAIPAVRLAGYEADDLIGTLARQAEAAGFEVVIVTSDKDMFQLLSAAVRIYDPVKDRWIGEADCVQRYGVEPNRVVEVVGLMGDATDNIPGVKGIGEKTAVKLIQQFGTIENLLGHVGEVTAARTRTLLTEQAEQARLSRQLATIEVNAPVEFGPDRFRLAAPPQDPLVDLLRELEFSSLLKMVAPAESQDTWGLEVDHITSDAQAKRFLGALGSKDPVGLSCLVRKKEGVPGGREGINGLALSAPTGRVAYVPLHGMHGAKAAAALPPSLAAFLKDPTRVKAAHDLKPILLALRHSGLELAAPLFDTMIAAYLLNPNRRSPNLEAVALEALGYRLGAEPPGKGKNRPQQLFDEDALDLSPEGPAVRQAAEAAAVAVRALPVLKARLKEQGSLRLLEDVEMPLVPVLADIEANGFCLDVEALQALSKELERELDKIMGGITTLAGESFNLNSPKQLAAVLFDKMGLTPIRKTKTGFSTDEETLTQLATQHDLPAQILNYRSLSKLKSTYVDALPALVNPDTGRLHTSLNQTVAATGRLSSTEPNLQNIPVKGEYGLRIREAFVAAPAHQLLSGDYSQIEPRILAHLSQDPRLLKVFERGEDIHLATAVEIFNLKPEQITRDMRRVAKTVVFGILYGISPFGLSSTLGITQQEAKRHIDTYFERYSGVKAFLDRTIEEARSRGYVTTILGRRRPIPELAAQDQVQRSFGERMAVNSPIQGSAADLIKVAMIEVSQRLKAELPAVKMILQVHDELIFEVPQADLERTKTLVRTEMERTGSRLGLSVPLKVDLGVGRNWREAHP